MWCCAFSSRYHLIQNGFQGRVQTPTGTEMSLRGVKVSYTHYNYYEEIELTGVRHLAKVKHLAECGGE